MRVAFIGVGNMGRPMAANIVKGGHEVIVYDAQPGRAAQVAAEIGATAARQPGDLGGAGIMITMLPDAHAVREVATGTGGIAFFAGAGTILVDMSSSQPLITRETGRALAARGMTLIDAPVSGGTERAAKGTLTIMIGSDDPAAVDRALPVLKCMGSHFFQVGRLGSGHAAKALNNVVAASNYAVLAEAMMVAERYGIDQATLIDIVNTSTGQSFLSTVVMKQFVIPGSFSTGFKVGLLSKDAAIAAELCTQLSCEAPCIQLANERWILARDALGAGEDHSRAIQAWQHRGGSKDDRA